MDIQEREAFENALQKRHKNILRWVMWVESIQKYVMSPKTERHDDVYAEKAYRKIQDFLYAWQAAKAVPEGFVLVPKADLESWHLWDGDSDNMYRDHYSESICDDVELGAVFEIDAKMAFKVDPIYVVPIYSDSDDFEYEEFESEELAKKAAAENKAMIELQEPNND